jgi:hypothetical protein
MHLSTASSNGSHAAEEGYSMQRESRKALSLLLGLTKAQIPPECRKLILDVAFSTLNAGTPYFPCPLKQTEAISALKAVETGIAAAIANFRFGQRPRRMTVDLDRASCFLFSAYLATVAGKSHHMADTSPYAHCARHEQR